MMRIFPSVPDSVTYLVGGGLAAVGTMAAAYVMQLPTMPPAMLSAGEPSLSIALKRPSDMQLEARAGARLRTDERIRASRTTNLGVRVDDGVATLWGRTTDRGIVPHAVALLRDEVKGLRDVTSEVRVGSGEDPLVEKIQTALAPPNRGVLPPLAIGEMFPPLSQFPPLMPQAEKREVAKPPEPPVAVEKPVVRDLVPRDAGPRDAGPRIPPQQLPQTEPVVPPRPPVVAVSEARPALPLVEQLERMRRGDPRYARLAFQVNQGFVKVRGSIFPRSAAWDLAERVQQLPGVEFVDVGDLFRD